MAYFLWISLIFGWIEDIALEAFSCFLVRGYIMILMNIVKAIILSPKLLPSIP